MPGIHRNHSLTLPLHPLAAVLEGTTAHDWGEHSRAATIRAGGPAAYRETTPSSWTSITVSLCSIRTRSAMIAAISEAATAIKAAIISGFTVPQYSAMPGR